MRKTILALLLSILLAPLFVGCKENVQIRSFEANNGVFTLDSQLFVVASAELSYSRIPREYWGERMEFIKQMGFNTVFLRAPWSLHEPDSALYDFKGDRDIHSLCRMAQQKGLLVWIHIGPAVDAHIDMGGLPWWLLKEQRMEFTAKDKLFVEAVRRYYKALAAELSQMQITKGGPIAMIQVGEPGTIVENNGRALSVWRSLAVEAGFDASLFTSASRSYDVGRVIADSLTTAVLVDNEEHSMSNFTSVRKLNAVAPFIAYDIDRRSPQKYGYTAVREWNKVYMRIFELLTSVSSFNISSLCAGTAFGHLSGAEISDEGLYVPYSSYSAAALVDEAFRIDEQYEQFFLLLNNYVHNSSKRDVPEFEAPLLQDFEETVVPEIAPLFDNLPQPIESQRALTMEQCNISSGAVFYATKLPPTKGDELLLLSKINDNAQLFFDGQPIAALSRNDSNREFLLPASEDGIMLHILVDAMGRVGNKIQYKDYKGIIGPVKIKDGSGAASEILGWENYPLAAEYSFAKECGYRMLKGTMLPGFYRAVLSFTTNDDLYLNMSMWSRGEVWINGHSLGRFWNTDGQATLFVPGCWLNKGDNELIILDWIGPVRPVVSGVKVR